MVVRIDVLRARLKKLRQMLADLHQIRAAGRKAYDDDPMRQLAAERALQIALQCILDKSNQDKKKKKEVVRLAEALAALNQAREILAFARKKLITAN